MALFFTLAHAELAPLSSEQMSAVSGRDGVAIGLDWRLNAKENGNVLGLCTDASTYTECRVSWAFSNRGTDDVDKSWLVLKGVSGALKVPYLGVEASSVSYEDDSSNSKTITAVELDFGGTSTPIQVKNLIIDNIALEEDNNSRRGYEADANQEPTGATIPAGSNTGFMGAQLNGPGNVANINVEGRVKLFSCLGDHPSC